MARRMTYEQKIEMAKSININVQEGATKVATPPIS